MNILGLSCFYHDSAACLLRDGEIVAAAQEERFTRKKHDADFPIRAVDYCLREAGIAIEDVDYVVFYDKPFLTFERILETYLSYAPKGLLSFVKAMTSWLGQKLWIPQVIKKELGYSGKILFTEHHHSHAASAYYPSPFSEAAFLIIDGVGEWATVSYGVGAGNSLSVHGEIRFPHSLGMLYSAFTQYTGFKVNSGEYKVMGLAPYGHPVYTDLIKKELIDVKQDGSFRLNMEYFDFAAGLTMTNSRFHRLFGGRPRKPESPLTQKEMDLARSLQEVTEEIILKLARHIHDKTNQKYLCLAGGVALNCVANGRLLREGPFEDIWIQPAAGDAGGALGAAFAVWYQYLDNTRNTNQGFDSQQGSYLGPAFSSDHIENFLNSNKYIYRQCSGDELYEKVADLLADEKIVGWFQGRMEFGPRALGNRSILGDARSPRMQATMNLKIKFRESFRPFAPSVLVERASEYFEMDRPSPYMLLTVYVKPEKRRITEYFEQNLWGIEQLNIVRSDIPAVTHVDYSARVQTVSRFDNERYYRLLLEFESKTGHGVLVNTSFNVRGEPIVCTPEDAYRCFMRTNMDYLVLGDFILYKGDQSSNNNDQSWGAEYQLD